MCTVSWTRTPQGYEVFFSRDERRTRPEGEPPRRWPNASIPALAPYDPQGGGTWIFVNAQGITACVMNAYESEQEACDVGSWASRGQLVLKLTGAHTLDAVHRHLAQALEVERYRPGFVLAWNRSGHARCWHWEDDVLECLGEPGRPMLTTSSFLPRQVLQARRDTFHRICGIPGDSPDPSLLYRFHVSADQTPSPFTVRMSRPDARTVSLTNIRVVNGTARMSYAPRHNDADFESASVHSLNLEGERANETRPA